MAVRPWVTPQEVRDYTEIKSVQERNDTRIAVDISRAEQYVISYNIFVYIKRTKEQEALK